MITREQAILTIFELVNSEILKDEVVDALEDIRICIEEEEIGRHVWGVPDDWIAKLHTSVRTDLLTEDILDEYDNIHKGITFKPSTFETKEIRDNVRVEMEMSADEVTEEDIDWFIGK